MRVQSYADVLLGPAARAPARTMVSTALPDGRARPRRPGERPKRAAERDRRRGEAKPEATAQADHSAAMADPGLALASTLAHLSLEAVRDAQGSRRAVLDAYAEAD